MNSPLRLIELLRVAEKDATSGCLRYGKHICKTHLTSLINEENVDGPVHFSSSPQPARAGRYQCAAILQGIEHKRIVIELFDEFIWTTITFICFLHRSER